MFAYKSKTSMKTFIEKKIIFGQTRAWQLLLYSDSSPKLHNTKKGIAKTVLIITRMVFIVCDEVAKTIPAELF